MRGWRVAGWIGLVLLVLGGLLWVAIAIRRSEMGEKLDELIARHESQGRGTTLAALLESEPPLDADVQARFVRWDQARRKDGVDFAPEEDSERWFLDDGELPEALRASHDALRPAMDELAGILATGRLRVSSLAWLRGALGDEAEPSFETLVEMRIQASWQLQEAAAWYQVSAFRGDGAAALDSLDAIHAALEPVGSILDAMWRFALGAKRDRTYVALAARGMLPAARAKAWLAEPPVPPAEFAAAYRGTRILEKLPLARALAAGDASAGRLFMGHGSGNLWEKIDKELYLRWSAGKDAARVVELTARVADYLRDAKALPALLETEAWRARAGPLLLPELDAWRRFTRNLVWQRTVHRAARFAVRAIGLRAHGAPPTSDRALCEALGSAAAAMDAGPWSLGLRYERPAPDRVRIVVDPRASLPAHWGPEDLARLAGPVRPGAEPLDVPLEVCERGVEVRVR